MQQTRSSTNSILPLLGLFATILLPLLFFGSVAHVPGHEPAEADVATLRVVHHYATPRLDTLVALATNIAGWLALPGFLAIAALLHRFHEPRSAAYFAITISGAWLLNLLAKAVYQRARPTLWVSPTPRSDYGFPSGHAMLSVAIATVFVVLLWPTRLRVPATAGAVAAVVGIGLSRLYLGVHYPSDILGGWGAGLAWSIGVYGVVMRRRPSAPSALRSAGA